MIRNPERLAGPLLAMKRRLGFLGSDRGGMLVTLEGTDHDGRLKADRLASGRRQRARALHSGDRRRCCWPSACSTARLQTRGAMPCVGLFTLDEFLAEVADLDIATGTA